MLLSQCVLYCTLSGRQYQQISSNDSNMRPYMLALIESTVPSTLFIILWYDACRDEDTIHILESFIGEPGSLLINFYIIGCTGLRMYNKRRVRVHLIKKIPPILLVDHVVDHILNHVVDHIVGHIEETHKKCQLI